MKLATTEKNNHVICEPFPQIAACFVAEASNLVKLLICTFGAKVYSCNIVDFTKMASGLAKTHQHYHRTVDDWEHVAQTE
ncbi:hypothetical protein TNCV_2137271 [Trichonephila clavipes]|nr:hypothetical protein TNCV_2137271 [Trichonephila clavipes]